VTEADQANYLTQAYQCLASDDIVGVAMWFGLQDIPGSTYAGGYGLFRTNGSRAPAAGAFRALAGGITPKPCGGYMDSQGPSITINKPTDGGVFKRELGVDAVASDSLGVRGVELWIDGRKFRYFGDPHAQMPILWPSREWKVGSTHTLTFKAFDEGGNVSDQVGQGAQGPQAPEGGHGGQRRRDAGRPGHGRGHRPGHRRLHGAPASRAARSSCTSSSRTRPASGRRS
jgi:hypothetical protein